MIVENDIINHKFKCYNHGFYTDDIIDFENHLCDPKLSHIEIISNGKCYECNGILNADINEGIEHRHYVAGMGMHKKCRQKMVDGLSTLPK